MADILAYFEISVFSDLILNRVNQPGGHSMRLFIMIGFLTSTIFIFSLDTYAKVDDSETCKLAIQEFAKLPSTLSSTNMPSKLESIAFQKVYNDGEVEYLMKKYNTTMVRKDIDNQHKLSFVKKDYNHIRSILYAQIESWKSNVPEGGVGPCAEQLALKFPKILSDKQKLVQCESQRANAEEALVRLSSKVSDNITLKSDLKKILDTFRAEPTAVNVK